MSKENFRKKIKDHETDIRREAEEWYDKIAEKVQTEIAEGSLAKQQQNQTVEKNAKITRERNRQNIKRLDRDIKPLLEVISEEFCDGQLSIYTQVEEQTPYPHYPIGHQYHTGEVKIVAEMIKTKEFKSTVDDGHYEQGFDEDASWVSNVVPCIRERKVTSRIIISVNEANHTMIWFVGRDNAKTRESFEYSRDQVEAFLLENALSRNSFSYEEESFLRHPTRQDRRRFNIS